MVAVMRRELGLVGPATRPETREGFDTALAVEAATH
jgi:hypothetical protein